MKQYIQNSIYGLLFCSLISCEAEHINLFLGGEDSEQITISVSVPGVDIETRAEDTQIESALNHLDLLIFDNNENNIAVQRITQSLSSPNGTIKLSQKRSDFTENADYSIYVIANSNTNLNDVKTLNDLKVKIQTDENIHLSGLSGNDIPSNFLMDGCVFNDELFENEPEQAGTIKLGNKDLNLKVVLRRAAAKVIVTLNKGKDISFIDNNQKGYYFKNIAKQTTLLKDGLGTFVHNDKIIPATEFTNSAHLEQLEEKTTIIGYMYSHSWDNTSTPTMVVNIPLQHNNKEHANSYYELKLTEGSEFKRNTCYMVNATINAPGAENESTPTQLNAIEYSTMDWENDINVNVGGVSQPTYLKVNQNELNMYNIATDATTLKFTSSSKVTVSIKEVYYNNKYSQKTTIEKSQYSANGISASPENALSGNIIINSNVPENFTIRYIKLKVTNDDNSPAQYITVMQYPVICITNELGWYSYRDDFKVDDSNPTTYLYQGDEIVSISVKVENQGTNYNPNYVWTGEYKYDKDSGGFWYSKVRTSQSSSNNTTTSYYEWSNNSVTTGESSSNNARMYHIRVMATSGDYVVARPKITDGITDPSNENQRLVSPSFMTASRLGVVTSNGGNLSNLADGCNEDNAGIRFDKESGQVVIGYYYSYWGSSGFKDDPDAYNIENDEKLEVFAEHCKQYVEVADDGTIYDDWRLPTAAEIQFIIDTQGASGEDAAAIDYLLNGLFYYSARGPVFNSKFTSSGKTIRCVRDAYDK